MVTRKKPAFREEVVNLQREQLNIFREQNAQGEKFMREMFERQLEHDKQEREKERNLVLELGKMFSSK